MVKRLGVYTLVILLGLIPLGDVRASGEEYSFSTGKVESQVGEYTYTVPGYVEGEWDVRVDNGTVEVIKVNGDDVTVKVDGGEVQKEISGEYLPEDIKQIKFTTNYLNEQRRILNNKFKLDLQTGIPEGYYGELTRRYVGSAERKFVEVDKYVQALDKEDVVGYSFEDGEWKEVEILKPRKYPYEDEQGYRGEVLGWVGFSVEDDLGDLMRGGGTTELDDYKYIDERDVIINPRPGRMAYKYKYKRYDTYGLEVYKVTEGANLITTPEIEWEYSGEVVRPEVDTREEVSYYKYEVTFEELYTGNTTGVQDVRVNVKAGNLAMQVGEVGNFGTTKIPKGKVTVHTEFEDILKISDFRGTKEGWRLLVDATTFKEIETGNEYVEGVMMINPIGSINKLGEIEENLEVKKKEQSEQVIIDKGKVLLLSAEEGKGSGEFEIDFGEDALSLVLDNRYLKVNKGKTVTTYESKINWDLVSAP